MTTEMPEMWFEQHNFRVDLGGVIALRSKSVYSSPGYTLSDHE